MPRPPVVLLLVLFSTAVSGPSSMAQALDPSASLPAGEACPEVHRVSRADMLQAMNGHGAYSITSTTTAMRFSAEALLEIVRRRKQAAPASTHLLINHADWFAAHLETAGVAYAEMSQSARAGFEHRQDALVDYGPGVTERVLEGPVPLTALDVTIFWPDTGDAPSEFSYRDTLSDPKVDMYDRRVIRFKLLEYEDLLLFDQISGISVRPIGFLSAVFAVLGKPDLRQARVAASSDEWQVMRGQMSVFAGISKTGTATIEPGGRGHERVPRDRPDLQAIAEGMKRPLKLRYGPPSCRTRLAMRDRAKTCRGVMGGVGTCAGE